MACWCFQATLRCYSYSIPSTPRLPVLRSESLRVIHCPINELLSRKGHTAPGSLSCISPIWIIEEMERDQVTVATGRQLWRWWGVRSSWRLALNSAQHLLLPLLMHCPPAETETERGRVEMELSSKQGGRENVCCNGICVSACVCVCLSWRGGASILSCLLGNKHTVHED